MFQFLFSIVYSWLLCHRLIDHICVGLFVGFLSCYIDLSVFVPLPYCFDYVALPYSLMSGNLIPPALFFFLRFALTTQGLLGFHTNFKNFCSSSTKNANANLVGIALNM